MSHNPKAARCWVTAAAFALTISNMALAKSLAPERGGATPTAGKVTVKVLAKNEKLQVYEAVITPGATVPMASRLGQVHYTVTGGTFERTFYDGSKDVVTRKTGETVLITEKRSYAVKNIGTTSVDLVEVKLK